VSILVLQGDQVSDIVPSPRKDAGATHTVDLVRCIRGKHLGYCPQCYCLVSFRYGCDFHGSKGEELLTKLPRNANQQRDQRVRNEMLDRGFAGTQPVATVPAEDGEANNVDDDDDAAAHKDDVEAPAYDHAQVYGQAPANAEAIAALSTTEQDVQDLAVENNDSAAKNTLPASAPTDRPMDDDGANVVRTRKDINSGDRRATAPHKLLVPDGGWQASRRKGKEQGSSETEPTGTCRKSQRTGGATLRTIAVGA